MITLSAQPATDDRALALLQPPTLTDHAFCTSHGRLLGALLKVPARHIAHNGWVNLNTTPVRSTPPLFYEEEARPTPVFTLSGQRDQLQAGDVLLLSGAQLGSGRVRLLVSRTGKVFPVVCYATDLQFCYAQDGTSALEILLDKLSF
jgi:hypothetical protein